MAFAITAVTSFAAAPNAALWADLCDRSAADPVFAGHAFNHAWWQAFCNDADCLCQLTILILHEGGTPVGVAPFYLSTVTAADAAADQVRGVATARIAARAAATSPPTPPLQREGSETTTTSPPTPLLTSEGSDAPPSSVGPGAEGLGERVVQLLGGVAVRDYGDIVAPRGREAEAWAAVLGYWDAQPEWDVLDLHALRPEVAAPAAAAAAALGWTVRQEIEETCPALALPATWDEYLAGLGKKDRHELRRKLRRIETQPAAIRQAVRPAGPDLAAAFTEFLTLHRLSGEAKAAFMTPMMAGFFRNLVAAGPPGLEIATLYVDEQPAAAYLSFCVGDRLLLYNSGYDPQYAELGAGFALLVYRIRAAISAGVRVFDFLRGDERYKYDLGAGDHFVYRVIGRRGAA